MPGRHWHHNRHVGCWVQFRGHKFCRQHRQTHKRSTSTSRIWVANGSIDLSQGNAHSGDYANYSFLWRHVEVCLFRADAKGTPTLRFERALSRSQTQRSTLPSTSCVVISQVMGVLMDEMLMLKYGDDISMGESDVRNCVFLTTIPHHHLAFPLLEPLHYPNVQHSDGHAHKGVTSRYDSSAPPDGDIIETFWRLVRDVHRSIGSSAPWVCCRQVVDFSYVLQSRGCRANRYSSVPSQIWVGNNLVDTIQLYRNSRICPIFSKKPHVYHSDIKLGKNPRKW